MVKLVSHPNRLHQKLKMADPYVKKSVLNLEAKLDSCTSRNAKLEVDNFALQLRVKALEKEIKTNLNLKPKTISVVSAIPRPSGNESLEKISELARKALETATDEELEALLLNRIKASQKK